MNSAIALGKDVQQTYEAIVAGDESVSWAVYGYEGQTELKVQASGADDLTEFAEEFSDGRLQYAFLRVKEPNSKLPKFVLVGWCGDGAPRKGVFQQHFSSIASKLTGFHVQITARSDEDISEANIMRKVEDAAGAKYSMSDSSAPFGPRVGQRKPTTNTLVNQLKGQSSTTFSARKPTQTEPRLPPHASTKPTVFSTKPLKGKAEDTWEGPKTNEHGRVPVESSDSVLSPPVQETIKSSYEPIGRPDINALRAQGQNENPSLSAQGTGSSYQPVQVPKTGSLADRMAAFTGEKSSSAQVSTTPRKASNPLASRFGGAIAGTKSAVPATAPRESKAIGGLAKNFGSEDGKTPAQLWAERKARERGESIPEPVKEPPVKSTSYEVDQDEERTNVSDIRERFAATSLQQGSNTSEQIAKPPPPPAMSHRSITPEQEQETEAEEIADSHANEEDTSYESDRETALPPPPPNMGTRPVQTNNASSNAGAGGDNSQLLIPKIDTAQHESEPEDDVETVEASHPVSSKNDFKAQLERTMGGTASHAEAVQDNHSAATGDDTKQATVLYDYEAQEDNEISLQEGEKVTNIDMLDEGWWSGQNAAGLTGLFPSNYVELIEADAATSNHAPLDGVPSAQHAGETSQQGHGQCATAVYEYEAAEQGEIGFAEGEMIEEIDQVDEGWWKGKNVRGEEGLFPSNYVELI